MSDLQKYINKRKNNDELFAENYDGGYEEFRMRNSINEAIGSVVRDMIEANISVSFLKKS